MPQICKQALERPICMLLGKEMGNRTVPSGSPLVFSLVMYCGANWTENDPQCPLSPPCTHYHVGTRKRVLSKEIIPPLFRMKYPPLCTLSVFTPAHFWPSLKHLFSRCCSWQALHDIKSEILTENQTAWRPLAAAFTDASLQISVAFLPLLDVQFTLTWNKWLYHNPLCPLHPFFLPMTLRSWQLCPKLH